MVTLVLLTFAAVFLAVAGVGLLLHRRQIAGRLAEVIASSPGSTPQSQSAGQRAAAVVTTWVARLENILPRSREEVSVVRKRLIRAGYRREAAVQIFYGLKVLVPLSLAALATASGAYHYGPFFVYGISLGLGFLIPDFVLGNRIRNRQLQIEAGLPDALDLMVICIEAGLGLDQAIHRVAQELRYSRPEIADELTVVTREQWAGKPRTDTWKDLAERTGVEAVRAVVATLVQADQFGTSVAKALRVHAETIRMRRRLQIEEAAAKTTVKLVFPLVFFVFPSLFVVALGPSVIRILEDFERYLSG
jgi:tight adherence protein C